MIRILSIAVIHTQGRAWDCLGTLSVTAVSCMSLLNASLGLTMYPDTLSEALSRVMQSTAQPQTQPSSVAGAVTAVWYREDICVLSHNEVQTYR